MKAHHTHDNRLIVALDDTALAPAVRMATRLRTLVQTVKVGSALFTACGPAVIHRLRSLGVDVMLDLKFFDIPSIVELSCRAAVRHRVAMVTVHALGGRATLEASARGVREEAARLRCPRPLVLAVTILTSTAQGRARTARAGVMCLAREAVRAGCDGVVAPAQEAGQLRRAFGNTLRIVCPGIRPRNAQANDQRRVATPAQALARGADALVVGRPITAARDPHRAAWQILQEMQEANPC
ncbi:MAG: orotidine-5'-phosphate decarboxylase [Candidatus Omnitrophica bacterium]|nr:orotidine-5'-phosphate decarboxylase [Candidatus Omnitrophota bacterium]